jgi:heavy metal sensor kinase
MRVPEPLRIGRLLARFGGLRLRVVVAFVLLLSVTLGAAGSQIYVSTKHRLVDELDLDLNLAVSQALPHVQEKDGRYVFQQGQGQLLAYSGESDLELSVLSLDGTQWDHAGAALAPVRPLSSHAFTVLVSGQGWRALAQPIAGSGGRVLGWVQAVRSLRPVDDALSALAAQLYIILPLAVLIAAIASYFLAGRALRPLTRIARTAEQIGPNTLGKRIGYQGPGDEVGTMATAFDAMLDRMQGAFERERRFSADASHELRTPLAVIKSGIGVALSRKRTAADHQATLETLDAQVDQLIRLCDDLLVLARGGRPRSAESETVDLTALLELVVEQLDPLAQDRFISVKARIRKRLTVAGLPDDLIRLFLNLLGNAVKYTPAGGMVTVDAHRQHGHVHVAITDTGPGIPKEHLPHLFEPFYRVDPSRARSESGTGLGLAIAHEIAGAHNGFITVQSDVGEGTTFEVVLPAQGGAAFVRAFLVNS